MPLFANVASYQFIRVKMWECTAAGLKSTTASGARYIRFLKKGGRMIKVIVILVLLAMYSTYKILTGPKPTRMVRCRYCGFMGTTEDCICFNCGRDL